VKRKVAIVIVCLVTAAVGMEAAGGDWMKEVPARDRQKSNPFRGREDAVQAGRLLFVEHCAECHGDNAGGKKKKPSLRTSRILSEATDGDVHWLLVNGNVRHGMPGWSKLPDPQLWQLVSYLKSLKAAE
jgi:mono/diheme cytochrome c family protein